MKTVAGAAIILFTVWTGMAHAAQFKPLTASVSSEYSGSYLVGNLFDGAPAVGSSANLGNQWASSGLLTEVAPIVGMDFGGMTNFLFTAIGYSQRSAGEAVGTIKLWFSNCPINWSPGNPPAGTPDETLTITNTSDATFCQYDFGGARSGRYVVAQFVGISIYPPGGYEFRLIGTGAALSKQYFSGANGASWDASTTLWGNAPGGPYNVAWGAGNLAVFEGAATNMTVGGNLTVAGIAFSNTSYSLEVGGARQLSSGSYGGDISGCGTLSYSSSANQTFGGAISGAGMLLKSGVGTLTLSGNNSYTGGTAVSNGTLRVDLFWRGGLDGNIRNYAIANGATLEFHNNSTGVDNLALSSFNLSGVGTILKTGPGYLDMAYGAANINSFHGAIVVDAGTLAVNSGTQGSGKASLTLNSGACFDVRTGTLQVDALNGVGTISTSFTSGSALSVGNNGGNGTFSGAIQNGASTMTVTKNWGGTQLLTGTNTYTGTTYVNFGGVLEIGGAGVLGGGSYAGAITITDGALAYSSGASQTFGGTISGAGALRHGGTGTLTLTGAVSCNITNDAPLVFSMSGNGAYGGFLSGTGTVSKVGGGTLTLPGAVLHSSSGTLSVSGGAVGLGAGTRWSAPVSVSSGCSLVGGGFYSGPVALADGASLRPGTASGGGVISISDLTLGNGTNVFALYAPGSASNGMVAVTNSWTVNNAVIAITSLQIPLPPGDYPLFSYTNAWSGSGFSPTVVGYVPSRSTWGLTNYNQCVYLHVAGAAASLKWDPTVSGEWNIHASSNWLDGVTKTLFYNYDQVTFDDAGAALNSTVLLVTNVLPNQITVSNSAPFKVTGNGTVACAAALQKLGSGTLTLTDAPNITCPIFLGGGVLCLDAVSTNLTYSQVFSGSGGHLRKTGAGTVTLTGSNTYSGGTTVAVGKLVFQQQAGLGVNSTIDTSDGAVTEWKQTAPMGLFTINPVTLTGAGRVNKTGVYTLYCDQSGGKFGINQSAGALFDQQAGTLQQGSGYGGNAFLSGNQGGLNVAADAVFELYGANAVVDALTGGGAVDSGWTSLQTLTIGVAGNTASPNNPYFSGTTATFGGVLQNGAAGTFALIKSGAGTQVLTGASTYSGGTTVSNGTLVVNNAAGSGTGSGALTVVGGTLGGTGIVSGVLTVRSGGTLAPGAPVDSVGVFHAATNVTLQAGAVLAVQVATNGVCDRLASSGTITVAGALLSVFPPANDIRIGTTFTVVSASTISGSFTNAPDAGHLMAGSRVFSVTYPGRTNVVLEAVNSGLLLIVE